MKTGGHSMHRSPRAHSLQVLCILFLIASAGLSEARAQSRYTASEALRNLQNEYAKINDYVADLNVVVDVPGVKMPPMDAKIYFKKPDKVHLDATGFAMLPRDVVGFNPSVFTEEFFDAVVQGEEMVDGARCLKVKLLAKSDTMRLQRVMLLVDQDRWIIIRMTTDPLQGNSAEAFFTYAFIENKYFLPSSIKLKMALAPNVGMHGGRNKFQDNKNTERKNASVILTYKNHRVNKGIDDAMFSKKAQ
jgi:hypothetical protein